MGFALRYGAFVYWSSHIHGVHASGSRDRRGQDQEENDTEHSDESDNNRKSIDTDKDSSHSDSGGNNDGNSFPKPNFSGENDKGGDVSSGHNPSSRSKLEDGSASEAWSKSWRDEKNRGKDRNNYF